MALQIDILYMADCNEWQPAAELTQQALTELGLEAVFNYWLIESDQQALQAYFIGSPTIRVNGLDLFPVEGASAARRLRSYPTEEGVMGHPTYNMLITALQAFAG